VGPPGDGVSLAAQHVPQRLRRDAVQVKVHTLLRLRVRQRLPAPGAAGEAAARSEVPTALRRTRRLTVSASHAPPPTTAAIMTTSRITVRMWISGTMATPTSAASRTISAPAIPLPPDP
jgi:hypothetical protein